jgi:RHS repeat-associated protein
VEVDRNGTGPVDTTLDYAYDDNGSRIHQVEGSSKFIYLIDGQNPTGYAQVLEEIGAAGALQRSYALGLDVVGQWTATNGVAYLLSDGHGSTRALLNSSGVVGQRYAYDAYGVMLTGSGLSSATGAQTSLLYSGEQTDKATGLQYLRARYYDPRTGRFNRLDDYAGNPADPQSLHKYLYAHGDPVLYGDPSGLIASLMGTSKWGIAVDKAIRDVYIRDHFGDDTSRSGRATKIGPRPPVGVLGSLYYAKVDLLNKTTERYGEVKPLSISGIATGVFQLGVRKAQF